MSTEKQIEANRLNAQKSTGPRTPNGKAASSRNAITHGLRSRAIVLPGEDPQAFQDLLQALRDEHQPQTACQHLLVEQAAVAWWKLARLEGIEHSAWIDRCRDIADDLTYQAHRRQLAEQGRDQEIPLQDELLMRTFANSRSLERLANHQQRLERLFHRSLRELQRLQARPRSQPPDPNPQIDTNEPNSDPPEPASAPADLPSPDAAPDFPAIVWGRPGDGPRNPGRSAFCRRSLHLRHAKN